LEELEPRTLLSASFFWDPTSGSNIDATQVINGTTYYVNWDVSMGTHTHPIVLPTSGDNVYFDGSSGINGHGQHYNGNAACTVSVNLAGHIFLQNGFTATITIPDGNELDSYGFVVYDIGVDNFVLAFGGPGAVNNFASGNSTPGNLSWGAGGKNTVAAGAALFIGTKSGLSQSTASPLIISGSVGIGPSSNTSGTSTFKLTNSSADITVNANGELDFYMPMNSDTLVDNTGTVASINNNGLVSLITSPGGTTKTAIFDVPLENHATLNANQGGTWAFNKADANNNDLSMDAGKIIFKNSTALKCFDGYTQTGGTLEIADNSSCTLEGTGVGATDNFNGGKIVFDSATGYGTLNVGKVIFNGVEIDMRIDGTTNASDKIDCVDGTTCKIQGNSKLVVTARNPVVKGSGITWTLIVPNPGNPITGDFLPANITLPPNVVETAGALPNSWQCNS
jgi:hypothetical protein